MWGLSRRAGVRGAAWKGEGHLGGGSSLCRGRTEGNEPGGSVAEVQDESVTLIAGKGPECRVHAALRPTLRHSHPLSVQAHAVSDG